MARKDDVVIYGIRFRFDEDAKAYTAAVSFEDIKRVYTDGYKAGIEAKATINSELAAGADL